MYAVLMSSAMSSKGIGAQTRSQEMWTAMANLLRPVGKVLKVGGETMGVLGRGLSRFQLCQVSG